MTTPAGLHALALVCSLKRSPDESSSGLMAEQVCENLGALGVTTEILRCADYVIEPGVEADMGNGDEWPKIREKVLAADILLISTPVWLGHPRYRAACWNGSTPNCPTPTTAAAP